MSVKGLLFRYHASKNDRARDAAIPLPEGVTECRNIAYGSHGKDNLLDVYFPKNARGALPTIVSIHGGGYVYGTKEIYRRYGMDMARRGFAFVNFNYRLAPRWKFPIPLMDTDAVMEWITKNARHYHLDPQRIFLVGDSAGAQLASQYAAIQTAPEYAGLFLRKPATVSIRALGLNCGVYDLAAQARLPRKDLALDYLGKDLSPEDPRLYVLDAIGPNYPPAYITTACHDFLRENAEPMYQLLRSKGLEASWKCYGSQADEAVAHVFHVNLRLPEARQCNDDTAAFFRKYL